MRYDSTKQTFLVRDMQCLACLMRLETLEDALPGIRRVTGSYGQQRLEIDYDDAEVTEAQIVAAAQAVGYAIRTQPSGA